MDIFSYLGKAVSKVLRGEKLTSEEKVTSSLLSLTVAAAAIPLAIEAGMGHVLLWKIQGLVEVVGDPQSTRGSRYRGN